MHSTLRIGRFGALTLSLHYTWLFVAILGLWWMALLWLPNNVPGRAAPDGVPYWVYWLISIAVMLLFLASVILQELVQNAVAGAGKRSLILYPFGSAAPYRLPDMTANPGRALLSALSGPVFSLALAAGLLLLGPPSVASATAGTPLDFARAVATPLSWLNLLLGIVSLIPGLPFDGGWALTAAIFWFSGDKEGALRTTRAVGQLAVLAIALLGAWRGLSTDSWLDALALVMLAWAAREAEESGRQRALLHEAFERLRARDLMDAVQPADIVRSSDSVAVMVKSHQQYAPDRPLPVLEDRHNGNTEPHLQGITTLSAAEALLQGTWPTTPITAIMKYPDDVKALDPDSRLTDLVAMLEEQPGALAEQPAIPVIQDGELVGSLEPSRLEAFEQIDMDLGAQDLPGTAELGAAVAPRGLWRRIGAVLPAVILVTAMAILGNIALQANPNYSPPSLPGAAHPAIAIGGFVPPDGATVATGDTPLSVSLVGARPITTASISLDGRLLDTILSDISPLQKSASAEAKELAQGSHTVSVIAVTQGGVLGRAEWKLWAGSKETPGATPRPPAAVGLTVLSHTPALEAPVLAGRSDLQLVIHVESPQAPAGAKVTVDGRDLETGLAPVEGVAGRYAISAKLAGPVAAGVHRAQAQIEAGTLTASVEWTFQAIQPDADNVYFKETGYFVSQPFLQYWQANGGLAIFGYPISDRVVETEKGVAGTYIAQYFERARFELHSSTAAKVILGRLGALVHPPDPPAAPIPGARFFPETGHNVADPFLKYWSEHGGLALFGYPISEQEVETNPVDGKQYKVQYFERARFELHPEYAGTPSEVQLGQLGAQAIQGERANP